VHLVLGGAVLALFVLLSLSGHQAVLSRKRWQHTLVGTLAVATLAVVLMRAGLFWLAGGVALVWVLTSR
jgi:hypothetical protein